MKKQSDLSQEAFNTLLEWLGPDRDAAGARYESIRLRLIKIFTCRGCAEAEDLADETINRVTAKVANLVQTYTGDPALYFYGVAQKVRLEYLRKNKLSSPPERWAVSRSGPPPETLTNGIEPEYECLERCMELLPPDSRQLVLRYYQQEKKAKIDNRRQLAQELGIALNALRIRAHRIRLQLQQCVQSCLERQPAY
jgi:RNA polymerase sigma factor (sigma-70 family)